MITESLAKSVELAEKVKHLLVATVAEKGTPHLATAERIALKDDDPVVVTVWFCPQTANNVHTDPVPLGARSL